MTQNFKQFVYCNENADQNTENLTASALMDGTAFNGYTITQLGIQAPPGTKFYINNNTNPVIIGFTGLFDIDLTNGGFIQALRFNESSINYIKQNDNAILIIDMAYLV